MSDDMNNNICDEICSHLLELNPTDSLPGELKEHLDTCAACATTYHDLLAINQGIEAMPEHDVSDEVFLRTLQAVKAHKTGLTTVKKDKGINPQWATGLAASFVLFAVTGLIYNGSISEFQADFSQIPIPAESEHESITQDSVEADGLRWRAVGKDERINIQLKENDAKVQQKTLDQSLNSAPAPKPTVSGTLDEIASDVTLGVAIEESSHSDKITVTGSRREATKPVDDLTHKPKEILDISGSGPLRSLDQLLNTVNAVASHSTDQPAVDLKTGQEVAEQNNPVRSFDPRSNFESKSSTEKLALKEQLEIKIQKRRLEMREQAQFKNQDNPLKKDKHAELSAETISADEMAEAEESASEAEKELSYEQLEAKIKERRNEMRRNAQLAKTSAESTPESELVESNDLEFKPVDSPVEQPRQDSLVDDLAAGTDNDQAFELNESLGGVFGKASDVNGTNNVAVKYLDKLQTTENLNFKSATGYWANTYLPGDPNMRWIQAELKQNNGLSDGLIDDLKLSNVQQNIQPFDFPSNAALGLYLNSDRKALNESGPTRMRLQVGIQAGQQKGGHRSALNLAVILDLDKNPNEAQNNSNLKEKTKALLNALLKAKQPADQMTVYTSSGERILSATNFKHGPIQVALERLFAQETVPATTDLEQTLSIANSWLKIQDDPNAVLGSSAVLLFSADQGLSLTPAIETMVQQNAIDGITLSTISLAGIEHRAQLERLALMGQGHSRVLTGVQDAQRLIKQELLVASRAVARALRLQIKLAEGVQLIDVLDSYSLNEAQSQQVRDAEQSLDQRLAKNIGISADRGQDDDGIQIVIPSYFAGDTHVILLDVLVEKSGPVAEVSAKYKDLIYLRNATNQKNLHMSTGQNNLGPLQLNVMKNMLAHHLSQTLDLASQAIRTGDHATAVVKLTAIYELYQAMRQHIPAWRNDAEMIQDEINIQQYLQLLNGQSSIDPKQYQLIADSMRFMSWRKLISHSP